jgi:ABC-type uncharacterized transport system permease subunit
MNQYIQLLVPILMTIQYPAILIYKEAPLKYVLLSVGIGVFFTVLIFFIIKNKVKKADNLNRQQEPGKTRGE